MEFNFGCQKGFSFLIILWSSNEEKFQSPHIFFLKCQSPIHHWHPTVVHLSVLKYRRKGILACYSVRHEDFLTLPWLCLLLLFSWVCLFGIWGFLFVNEVFVSLLVCFFEGVVGFWLVESFWEMLLLISLSKYVYQKKRSPLAKIKTKKSLPSAFYLFLLTAAFSPYSELNIYQNSMNE